MSQAPSTVQEPLPNVQNSTLISMPVLHEQDLSDVSGVLAYLQETTFASSDATVLSGGFGNFTYRLHLRVPYEGHDTLVLKHAKPYVASPYVASGEMIPFDLERQVTSFLQPRLLCIFTMVWQIYEVEALTRVKDWLPAVSLVTVPTVHLFDQRANAIIMDDCGNDAITLKEMMLKISPSIIEPVATEFGGAIGEFLGLLHNWGRDNDEVLRFFDRNEQAKSMSAWATYGRLVSTLTGELPSLPNMHVSSDDLEIISKLASEKTTAINSCSPSVCSINYWYL